MCRTYMGMPISMVERSKNHSSEDHSPSAGPPFTLEQRFLNV